MRPAISMLELVVAIVVMGIAVSSLPLILSQTQKNNAVAMQQEAILATKTRMGLILTYEWDANTYDPTASPYSRVLDTTGTSADNAFNTAGIRRAGHIDANNRRRLHDLAHPTRTPTSSTSSQWGAATIGDIDDFHSKEDRISVASKDFDFILNIRLASTVSYVQDTLSVSANTATFTQLNAPIAGTTNIKRVRLEATDHTGDNNLNIVLDAFAANIGESPISRRTSW